MKVNKGHSASSKRNLNPVNKYKLRSKLPDKVTKKIGKKRRRPRKKVSEEELKEVLNKKYLKERQKMMKYRLT